MGVILDCPNAARMEMSAIFEKKGDTLYLKMAAGKLLDSRNRHPRAVTIGLHENLIQLPITAESSVVHDLRQRTRICLFVELPKSSKPERIAIARHGYANLTVKRSAEKSFTHLALSRKIRQRFFCRSLTQNPNDPSNRRMKGNSTSECLSVIVASPAK